MPSHRRSGSAGTAPSLVTVAFQSSASIADDAANASGGSGSAASGNEIVNHPESHGGGALQLDLLVHDNLTLGLLRQRIKRELVAAGYPKVSYRHLALLVHVPQLASHTGVRAGAGYRGTSSTGIGYSSCVAAGVASTNDMAPRSANANVGLTSVGEAWKPLEGEMRTLRELGVGDGTALAVRIALPLSPRADGERGPLNSSSQVSSALNSRIERLDRDRSTAEGKQAALPAMMIAQSNAYMAGTAS